MTTFDLEILQKMVGWLVVAYDNKDTFNLKI